MKDKQKKTDKPKKTDEEKKTEKAEYNKKYYQDNKETFKKYHDEWIEKNKEYRKEYTRYLPLTEPAAVGAWFWRWRSRPIWSVAQDTLQPATVWSPGRDGSGTISTDSGVRESG